MHRSGSSVRPPTLDDKVAFLASPGTYPHRPDRVELIETHMSWVFLAGSLVYKLKKPVRFPHLDLSTVAARQANCREEVRVNRRLAGDVYRGVAALSVDAGGALHLNAPGEPVDWLVEMRRLPAARFLSTLLTGPALVKAEIARLAAFLGDFYRTAERPRLDPGAYWGFLAKEQQTSRDILMTPGFADDPDRTEQVLDRLERALSDHRPTVERRVAERRIVEAHGDLRPEHVCLTEPIVVFDALEFSRELRLLDPFDELAFLSMECTFAGAPWIGPVLVRGVAARLGDEVPGALMATYMASRAVLRGRLTLSHLLDGHPQDREKWTARAARYVALADRILRET
jgi:aminoglycoside phosphotransferase family enzyme